MSKLHFLFPSEKKEFIKTYSFYKIFHENKIEKFNEEIRTKFLKSIPFSKSEIENINSFIKASLNEECMDLYYSISPEILDLEKHLGVFISDRGRVSVKHAYCYNKEMIHVSKSIPLKHSVVRFSATEISSGIYIKVYIANYDDGSYDFYKQYSFDAHKISKDKIDCYMRLCDLKLKISNTLLEILATTDDAHYDYESNPLFGTEFLQENVEVLSKIIHHVYYNLKQQYNKLLKLNKTKNFWEMRVFVNWEQSVTRSLVRLSILDRSFFWYPAFIYQKAIQRLPQDENVQVEEDDFVMAS